MSYLRYTLVTDGPSDQLLKHPIEWLLAKLTSLDFDGEWANPSSLLQRSGPDAVSSARKKPQKDLPLATRLGPALESYPCQLVFIHRDAERGPREDRVTEIVRALGRLSSPPPAVCVVPVRMTEAWLLFNEQALREAAGNPNGQMNLVLPTTKRLESLPDPKQILRELLEKASGLNRRRLKRFRWSQARQRLAELIDDYSPLEQLLAFRSLKSDLKQVLIENGWAEP